MIYPSFANAKWEMVYQANNWLKVYTSADNTGSGKIMLRIEYGYPMKYLSQENDLYTTIKAKAIVDCETYTYAYYEMRYFDGNGKLTHQTTIDPSLASKSGAQDNIHRMIMKKTCGF